MHVCHRAYYRVTVNELHKRWDLELRREERLPYLACAPLQYETDDENEFLYLHSSVNETIGIFVCMIEQINAHFNFNINHDKNNDIF